MTNFEKIKKMSLDEFAQFLSEICPNIAIKLNDKYVSNMKGSLCEWLESEVEE